MLVSIACAFLSIISFNLMFLGLALGSKKVFGSALLFTAGIACLFLLFGVGMQWNMDIGQTLRYAPIGFPLSLIYLRKRLDATNSRPANPRPANWPPPPQDKVDRITKGVAAPPAHPKP